MKESLSAIPKQPIFRETFTDEQTTRLNGGTIETPITFTNGVANFTANAKGILYNFVPKLFSVRIKFTNRTVNSQDNYLFGSNETTKYILILNNNNLYGGLTAWSATYINGVSTNILGTITSGEIVVTGISNYTASNFRLGGKNTVGLGFEGSLELVEIYDYTLTANEVKNLYEGKRNRPIDLQQTATSISNYYQGVGVSGNYVSTPNAVANQITGDIEIVVNAAFDNLATTYFLCSKIAGASNFAYEFTRDSNNKLVFSFSLLGAIQIDAVSTVIQPFSIGVKGWVKASRNSTTGNVIFSTSTDGITFTQLGTTVSTTAGSIFAGTRTLGIGGSSAGSGALLGKIYRATVSNSIGGTPVVDFNPATYNASTSQTQWTSATGEIWTISTGTATTGYKGQLVSRTIVQADGTDDYMRSGSVTVSQPSTSYSCFRVLTVNTGKDLFDGQTITTQNEFSAGGTLYAGLSASITSFNPARNLYSVNWNGISSNFKLNDNAISGSVITGTQGITGLVLFGYFDNTFVSNANLYTLFYSNVTDSGATRTATYNLIRSLNENAF